METQPKREEIPPISLQPRLSRDQEAEIDACYELLSSGRPMSRRSWKNCAVSERAARSRMPTRQLNWPRSASNSTRPRQTPALSNHPIKSTRHPLRFLSRRVILQKPRDRNSDASFGSALSAVLPQAW